MWSLLDLLSTLWDSPIAQLVKNPPAMQETLVCFLGQDSWASLVAWEFPGKESTCNSGDLGLIPGLGGFSGEAKGYPLQYYGLENSMACVHGVAESWTRLSNFHFSTLWSAFMLISLSIS